MGCYAKGFAAGTACTRIPHGAGATACGLVVGAWTQDCQSKCDDRKVTVCNIRVAFQIQATDVGFHQAIPHNSLNLHGFLDLNIAGETLQATGHSQGHFVRYVGSPATPCQITEQINLPLSLTAKFDPNTNTAKEFDDTTSMIYQVLNPIHTQMNLKTESSDCNRMGDAFRDEIDEAFNHMVVDITKNNGYYSANEDLPSQGSARIFRYTYSVDLSPTYKR